MYEESTASALGQLFFYDKISKRVSDNSGNMLAVAQKDKERFQEILEIAAAADQPAVVYTDICVKGKEGNVTSYHAGIVCTALR